MFDLGERFIKTCTICKRMFLTWMPFRDVCNKCLCDILNIKIKKEEIDASKLTFWGMNEGID